MAKTSRPQNVIREYNDVPLSPDFTKTGDDFVDDLMKQCGYSKEEVEQTRKELKSKK